MGDHYAAYDSSVVHAHYQDHKNIDPLITGYPTTQKKQESVVVQGFTLDTLQASTWPNGKAVNDFPQSKITALLSRSPRRISSMSWPLVLRTLSGQPIDFRAFFTWQVHFPGPNGRLNRR